MNDKQREVLVALNRHTVPNEWYTTFAPLVRDTGIERGELRRAVRFLARRGYAAYSAGLMLDDGTLAGAGYCITAEGRELAEEIE